MTLRYVVPAGTRHEVEAWCTANGYEVGHIEIGPDGLWRGTCIVPERSTHDATVPAARHDGG